MKKLKLLKTINCILVLLLVTTLFLLYLQKLIPFDEFWYVVVIIFYAIMLYCKYFLIGSDNVLWFAICLTLLAGYIIMYNLNILEFKSFPMLILIPAMASLIVFFIYKNILHLNLFVIFSFVGTPMFLISYGMLNIWWFLLLEFLSVGLALVTINVIYYNYKR